MKKLRIYLLIAVFTSLLFPLMKVQSAAPSPYDLIAMVNDLRQNNSLPAMETDGALMAAAQMQSDYLASEYGTNFPSWDMGHIGAGGTYAIDRAAAAGYYVGPGWNVLENWAGGNNSTTLSEIVYTFWNDEAHMGNMLHPDVVHVGAGVTEGDGFVYYIIDFAVKYGSGGSSSGGVASTVPTTAVTPKVAPVTVATPNEDGSIIHEVEIGQALWSIAAAYEVTVDQLLALNNLSGNAVIYEGDTLLVQPAYTPTPSPTATQTPRAPTRTPVPAQTAQAVKTQAPNSGDSSNGFLGLNRQAMGLALILICGIGLVLIIVGTMAKDKKPEPPQSE
jgi:LysM repeat protein